MGKGTVSHWQDGWAAQEKEGEEGSVIVFLFLWLFESSSSSINGPGHYHDISPFSACGSIDIIVSSMSVTSPAVVSTFAITNPIVFSKPCVHSSNSLCVHLKRVIANHPPGAVGGPFTVLYVQLWMFSHQDLDNSSNGGPVWTSYTFTALQCVALSFIVAPIIPHSMREQQLDRRER